MQYQPEKRKKRQKRTQYMCAAMLRRIRIEMFFEPRDMYRTLGLPRRTYQDYEAGRRSIPQDLAAIIREAYRRHREFMAGIGARVDEAIEREFPGGVIPSFEVGKGEEL